MWEGVHRQLGGKMYDGHGMCNLAKLIYNVTIYRMIYNVTMYRIIGRICKALLQALDPNQGPWSNQVAALPITFGLVKYYVQCSFFWLLFNVSTNQYYPNR